MDLVRRNYFLLNNNFVNTIAVNGKYLVESSYQGSGFHSYLKELIKGWEVAPIENRYHIFLPNHTGITSKQAARFFLQNSNSSKIIFQEIPQTNSSFENDIVTAVVANKFHSNGFFFPHLDLPTVFTPHFPLVVVIHDIIPTLFLTPTYLFRGKTPLKMISKQGISDYFLIKKYLPHIKFLITISETSKQSLISVFGKSIKKKIKVISPAAGESFHKKDSLSTLKKYKLKPQGYTIYFGGYTARKNYIRLVKAYTRACHKCKKEKFTSNEFPLVMVGGKGKEIFISGADEIIWLPKLPEKELIDLLAEACFSIYPSLFEGFGLPIIESIVLGTLPLMSDIPSSREIVTTPIPYLFFNPYDIDAMTESIYHYLYKPKNISDSYDKIKYHAKKYSWVKSAQKIDSLFSVLK